jgi:hypothetical protein
MRWQVSQSSSSVAKPQEHKRTMALAVPACCTLGQLGVDSAHVRLDRRADRRVGPGQGETCRQLAPSVFELAVCQAADYVVTH